MLVLYCCLVLLAIIVTFLLLPLKTICLGQHYSRRPGPLATATISPIVVGVGAGVIGLCTAYHLAKANNLRATEHRHRIVVVEDGKEVFPATSAATTGILSYADFVEDLRGFARYSYDICETLGRSDTVSLDSVGIGRE